MPKKMVLVGDDKIGRLCAHALIGISDLIVILDHSTDMRRVLKLLTKRRLSVTAFLRMSWAETCRSPVPLLESVGSVRSNQELLSVLRQYQPTSLYLFRTGLIISNELLRQSVSIFNVHCARLPEFSGLGAIDRALQQKQYEQRATLHEVTAQIDGGKIIDEEAFLLKPTLPYRINEEIAYQAGFRLLTRQLHRSIVLAP